MMRKIILPASMLIAGLAAGAAAGYDLQAPAKPLIYEITEIDVSNPEAYLRDYLPKVRAAREKAGGHVLAATAKVTALYGSTPPQRVGITVWDSLEHLQAVRASPEFKAARAIGERYATFREFAVEGGTYATAAAPK